MKVFSDSIYRVYVIIYTLSDLTKMDVKLYGIKVGEVDSIDLSFNTMIDRLSTRDSHN